MFAVRCPPGAPDSPRQGQPGPAFLRRTLLTMRRMTSPLRCPRCNDRMAHLLLAGRYDKIVEVEHCGACRLVWFDEMESVQLAGLGWIRLLRHLQQGAGLALPSGKAGDLACPRCTAPLKTVRNLSRYGLFAALECPRGHGHLQSHGGLLAERGLVRALLPADRSALLARQGHVDCLNCGAPVQREHKGSDCLHCASPLVVLDLPRLAHALSVSPHESAPPRPKGLPLAWHCVACGAPMDPGRQAECPSCRHSAMAPTLLDLTPLLDEAEQQMADAATERLLKAAQRREQRIERPRRAGDWRETQFARLQRFIRPEEEQQSRLSVAATVAVLALFVLLSRCGG